MNLERPGDPASSAIRGTPGAPRMRQRGRIAPPPQAAPPPPRPGSRRKKRLKGLLGLLMLAFAACYFGWDHIKAASPAQAARVEAALGDVETRARGALETLKTETWPWVKTKLAVLLGGGPKTPAPAPAPTRVAAPPAPPPAPVTVPTDPAQPPTFARLPDAELPREWEVEFGTTYDLPPPVTAPAPAAVLPGSRVPAAPGGPELAEAPGDPDGTLLAGEEGTVLGLPTGVRVDLRPGTRYQQVGAGLRVVAGGARFQLPASGGELELGFGTLLSGADALGEVWVDDAASGTVDVVEGAVSVEVGVTAHEVPAGRRLDLEEGELEPLPPAHADRTARALRWFASRRRGT